MNAAQAKRIPLRGLLASLGLAPKRESPTKGELWYLSPFREETSPSFKVDEAKNLWYDFGLGGGGNVVDFAIAYFRVDVAGALRQIDGLIGPSLVLGEQQTPVPAPALNSVATASPEAATAVTPALVVPVSHRSLIGYLGSRAIPVALARQYLQELHYQRNGKAYFTLGFPNASGGYELRNRYFKGTWAPKDISEVPGTDPTTVAIFEGFMDFLSALSLGLLADPRPGVIVVNSAALRAKALAAISPEVSTAELFFDHDGTGRDLTWYFRDQLAGRVVVDRSEEYSGYKDLNAWTMAQVGVPPLLPPVER